MINTTFKKSNVRFGGWTAVPCQQTGDFGKECRQLGGWEHLWAIGVEGFVCGDQKTGWNLV